MKEQIVLDRITILLEPKEEIEYASIEKNLEHNVIVLTNQRIIYTNKNLFKKDTFLFFTIKDNTSEVINRFKRTLQSDYDLNILLKKYFNDVQM